MRTIIVHPRRNMLIRKGLGLGDFVDMDGLNDDLSFQKTYHMSEDGESKKELLERVRGTGAGRSSIPDDGWVEVEVDDNANLQTIFKEAQKQKEEGNFV